MKKCFGCNRKFPLFMFSKDNMKYQRPSDQGRVKCCRICNYKTWSKYMEAWMFNYNTGRFNRVEFKNKWEVIKRVIK